VQSKVPDFVTEPAQLLWTQMRATRNVDIHESSVGMRRRRGQGFVALPAGRQ
jgi:hypothetical protein